MMQRWLKFSRTVDAISERVGWVGMLLVIVTVLIGFYNVTVRYLGEYIGVQLSSNVFIELQWYLYSLVFFSGFAYILKNGINVRVDFIYAKWSKKRKATLDFWGHLFFLLPFSIMGIYVTISPVLKSWQQWEQSPDPGGLPRAPIKSMIIIGFALLLAQTISELVKLWATMKGQEASIEAGDEPEAPIRIE